MSLRLQLFLVPVLVCGMTALAQVLPPPTNVTVQPGLFGGAALHWDTVSGARAYVVYKSVDRSEFWSIAATHRNGYLDWYVAPGRLYQYYVTSFSMEGESAPSDTVRFWLKPKPPLVHGVITGRVTDQESGEPIQDAVIRFFTRGGLWNVRTHTDTGGFFWAELDTGKYVVRADKFGYFGEWFDNALHLDSATVINLHQDTVTANFALRQMPPPIPVSVSGTVMDSVTGKPLRNAFVAFLRPHRWLREIQFIVGLFGGFDRERLLIPEIGLLHGVVWRGLTDTSGAYQAMLIRGFKYIAFAYKWGYVHQFYNNKYTPLGADRIFLMHDTTGIDFTLVRHSPAPNTLAGAVADSSGSAIPASVVLFRRTVLGRVPVRFSMTDSLGNFAFYHVANGEFFVKVVPIQEYAPAWYSSTSCGVRNWRFAERIIVAGDVSGINVCVVPSPSSGYARIAGQIVENPGKATRQLVSDATQGVTVYAVSNTSGEVVGYDVTEDDGSYSIDNLPAGTYTIVVDKEGYAAASSPTYTVDETNNYEVSDAAVAVTPEAPEDVADWLSVPTVFSLEQNYPNPFNPNTQIRFAIPRMSTVNIRVFNLIGQEVVSLLDAPMNAGTYTLQWNGTNNAGQPVSSGIYFIKLSATPTDKAVAPFTAVRKMILVK